ncbi:hypothetical protein ABLE94_21255 [Gordonia sp. VNK1]|uniref:hypothetical protein n=1 Tax=Gordonia oleivorans TaxID=3156618 RepID=UPI0032B396E2
MKKTLKRAVAGVAVAAGIASGSMLAAGEAQAATPGDLGLYGGVNCYWKGWGPTWDNLPGWRMHRWMGVKNFGGSVMTNVSITEINGATKYVPARSAADAKAAGAINPRATKVGELLPGQAYTGFDTTWRACFPSSISGYTIGQQTENVFDKPNFGFWANVEQQQGTPGTVNTPSTATN